MEGRHCLQLLAHGPKLGLDLGPHGHQLALDAAHQHARQPAREPPHAEQRRVQPAEVRVGGEEALLALPGVPRAQARGDVRLGAVLDHDVAELERLALVGEHRGHLGLRAGPDQVRLGQHAHRAVPRGVHLLRALKDVDCGDVLVGGDHGQDERALLPQVRVDQRVDLAHDLRALAGGGRADDAGQVDQREVGRVRRRDLHHDRLRAELRGLAVCQGVCEPLDEGGELLRRADGNGRLG
mmetsp:Transcript_22984/g.36299  ORF Transcript_22984/g.36299 Transcript_22984/m.36299 type:complete len:239 (+) Transcript_22984:1476-2192(+)